MHANERGSTLVLVLLVILVFSVIGVSLMGSVIGENKRVHITEAEMQARYLAESGLTYFEKDFARFISNTKISDISQVYNFLDNYNKEVKVGNDSEEKAKLSIVRNDNMIEVYSEGAVSQFKRALIGVYELAYDIDIDERTYELADFTKEDTAAINFAEFNVLKLGLGELLGANLIELKGSDDRFYAVPNDKVVEVNLLGPILNINIGNGSRFKRMETMPVLATRSSSILKLRLLGGDDNFALVRLNVLDLREEADTNVLITGEIKPIELLGFTISGYRDINFKKLAVLGNVNIKQEKNRLIRDNASRRYFSFQKGLYVNRSLIIGDAKHGQKSNLGLNGNIVAMENLIIMDSDLLIKGNSDAEKQYKNDEDYITNIYVHGDAHIKNTCIKFDGKYDFRLFAKGKITFENQPGCNSGNSNVGVFKGLLYSETGIEFKPNGKNMIFQGAIIGDYSVDGDESLFEYQPDEKYFDNLIVSNIRIEQKGRKFD